MGCDERLHYITALQTHAHEVRQDPSAWMPWNYQAALPAHAGPGPPPV